MVGAIPACQQSSPAQENALLAAAKRAWDKNGEVFAELRALEANAMAAVGADAERQGKRLTIHLKSRATRTFEDRPECESVSEAAKCQQYLLIAHARSRGRFVVARLYYESAEFALIDDSTGDETIVRSFPVFSPSGNRVLVLLINDDEIGCGVQIWRREGRKFVLEWSGAPHINATYTSYQLVDWPAEDRIELQAENYFEWPKPNLKTRFELRRAAGGWKVVEVR